MVAFASPSPFALGAVVIGVGAVVAAVAYGFSELRIAWHVLRSRPASALDATSGGPIELAGVARSAGRTVRAPFTGTRCLAVEYVVEEERNTKNGRTWATVASGDEYVPFLLETDDGSVVVEPPGADLRLERERRITVEGGTAPPEPIRRFVERTADVDSQERSIDLGPFELRTGKDRRFVERRLDVGESVHVLGRARYDTTVGRAAGQVNAAIGVDPAALSSSFVRRLRHRLVGYPFVISDRDERTLGAYAALRGVAATAVGIVGAWFLVAILA